MPTADKNAADRNTHIHTECHVQRLAGKGPGQAKHHHEHCHWNQHGDNHHQDDSHHMLAIGLLFVYGFRQDRLLKIGNNLFHVIILARWPEENRANII